MISKVISAFWFTHGATGTQKSIMEFHPRGFPDSSIEILHGAETRGSFPSPGFMGMDTAISVGRVTDAKHPAMSWISPQEKNHPSNSPLEHLRSTAVLCTQSLLPFLQRDSEVFIKQLLCTPPRETWVIKTTPPFKDLPSGGGRRQLRNSLCRCSF